jgi:hypothetical protein
MDLYYGRMSGNSSRAAFGLLLDLHPPAEFEKAKAAGKVLPGPHSAAFAPDREPTIRTGAAALTASVLELLRPAAGPM